MSILTWLAVAIAGGIVLAYQRAPLIRWTGATALLLVAIHFLGTGLSLAAWTIFALLAVIFNVRPIRRALLSRPLLGRFQALHQRPIKSRDRNVKPLLLSQVKGRA